MILRCAMVPRSLGERKRDLGWGGRSAMPLGNRREEGNIF